MSRNTREHHRTSASNWKIVPLVLVGCFAIACAIFFWPKPPAVAVEHMRYVQLLRTAVSAQNSDQLKGVERALTRMHEEEVIDKAQWRHFQTIISQAKSGEWEKADRACQAFESAQQYRTR